MTPYIVIEGIDGAGKTTIATQLFLELRRRNWPVAQLSYPGKISRAGNLIYEIFAGRSHFAPEAMLWLFTAELADLEPQIRAMRNDNVTIVCDRHTMFSAFVYQEMTHGRGLIKSMINAVRPVQPTHVYVVDIPSRVALQRRARRAKSRNSFYENDDVDALDRKRKQYQELSGFRNPPIAWPERSAFKILDGEKAVQENVDLILSEID